MLSGSAGREISKEEGGNRLAPSFAMLKRVVRLRLCGRSRRSGPNDDIIQHGCGCIEVVVIPAVTLSQQQLLRCWLICVESVSVSEVINFRLETVITPLFLGWLVLLRSSSQHPRGADYYFFGLC